jgi:hypothetical protein
MAVFSIYHGAVTLYSWDLDSGTQVYAHPAWAASNQSVVSEKDGYGFHIDPSDEGVDYQISIGDVPVDDLIDSTADAGGWVIEGRRLWVQQPYFDSARGATPIVLKERDQQSSSEHWRTRLAVSVDVIPTKIGDAAYEAMAADLLAISRGLLVDLYGKSTRSYDLRFSARTRKFHSKEEELESIATIVDRLGGLLEAIQRSPASRITRKSVRAHYWGTERLDNAGLTDLIHRGIVARSPVRPITVLQNRLVESFDIAEHRMMKAFISLLISRVDSCIEAIVNHIGALHADRQLRDVRRPGSQGPTLYESIDMPKLRRLGDALQQAQRLRTGLISMHDCSLFQAVEPTFGRIEGGAFQRNSVYRELLSLMSRFLGSEAVIVEGDDFSTVTKLTWRLFEQWSLVRVVNAFRDAGVVHNAWNESLRQHVSARFTLDFERGLSFEGTLSPGFRLKIRYEPWILGEAAAKQLGETLCRGSVENVAWSPDVVIELLDVRGEVAEPVYAIVMDCKYTPRINEHHLHQTSKYFEIRSTRSRRQVVHQLWLIHLGTDEAIVCTDPAVAFNDHGPSMPPSEHATFLMSVAPRTTTGSIGDSLAADGRRLDVLHTFAAGTVDFLRREFVYSAS